MSKKKHSKSIDEDPDPKKNIDEEESFEDDLPKNSNEQAQENNEPSNTHSKQKINEFNIDFKDKYLRLLAENENLKRRVQKESKESIRYATRKIILDLLPPLDQFESALSHAKISSSEEVQNWAVGFKMILHQFKDWIYQQGVEGYASQHQIFDPKIHEAVETQITTEHKDGIIIKELSRGYKMGGQLLRPARVVVAKAQEKHKNNTQKEELLDSLENRDSEEPSTSKE
jgi:molecular chaperone GrpE